jgi:tRNA(fMet)-specific endonuclease VapC
MARFVLDTHAVSELARPLPDRQLLARFGAHGAAIAIGAPTLHELRFGAARMPLGARRSAVESFLSTVVAALPVLPYDGEAAAWHAGERARLVALGRTPPLADGLVAAVAARHGCTLVTHNVRDFADFVGLDVVDWMEA